MARYFFHVRDHRGRVEDEEGSEHADLDHAVEEAKSSARDLAKQDIDDRISTDDHCIEICDATGHVLVAVPIAEVLEHPQNPHFGDDCRPRRQ